MACLVCTIRETQTRDNAKSEDDQHHSTNETHVKELLRPELAAPTHCPSETHSQDSLRVHHQVPRSSDLASIREDLLEDPIANAHSAQAPPITTYQQSLEPLSGTSPIEPSTGQISRKPRHAATVAFFRKIYPFFRSSPQPPRYELVDEPRQHGLPNDPSISYTTSTSDSTSVGTSISGTSPISLSSTRTSLGSHCMLVDVASPQIYLWHQAQPGTYIGRSRECPPPPALNMQWWKVVRVRLLGDLRPVLQSLPPSMPRNKTVVEPEFCMMGTLVGSSDTVELKPTILIRCGSRRCQNAVENVVEDLEYLKTFSDGHIIVHRRAPKFAADQDCEDEFAYDYMPQLDIDSVITVNVAITDFKSACGLNLTCERTDSRQACTLGGLIRVDGRVYGLTTAHALVQVNEKECSDVSSDDESSYDDQSSSSSFTKSTTISQCSRSSNDGGDPVTFEDEDHNTSPSRWITSELGPYSYANQRYPSRTNNAFSVSEGSDFALIYPEQALKSLPNTYSVRRRGLDVVETITSASSPSTTIDDGGVSIICSPTNVLQGHLVPGDHLFFDRNTIFCTKKIQLEIALREYFY